MMTPEELEELSALETEAKEEADKAAAEAKRAHLEALRLRKRITATGRFGTHGDGFVVLETTAGNFAIRRPLGAEVDLLTETIDDEEPAAYLKRQEAFVLGIILEPTEQRLKELLVTYSNLVNLIIPAALGLLGKLREASGKK